MLNVQAPNNAIILINGQKTHQTGSHRDFTSTGLEAGKSYTFEVRAQWAGADGKPVDITRKIPVHGGERWVVDFNVASANDITPVGNQTPR